MWLAIAARLASAVRPLLRRALRGHRATAVFYGQTGTGKTYTLMGMLERVAAELGGMPEYPSDGGGGGGGDGNGGGGGGGGGSGGGARVRVSFFEIHGKKAYDLLQGRKEVHLRADAAGEVHVRGAAEPECRGAQQLMDVVAGALALRSSEVTERNPISSRSHAVCHITVLGRPAPGDTPRGAEGTLVSEVGQLSVQGKGEGEGRGKTIEVECAGQTGRIIGKGGAKIREIQAWGVLALRTSTQPTLCSDEPSRVCVSALMFPTLNGSGKSCSDLGSSACGR
jgi:hypothetical protein